MVNLFLDNMVKNVDYEKHVCIMIWEQLHLPLPLQAQLVNFMDDLKLFSQDIIP